MADPPPSSPAERPDRAGTLLAGRYRFVRRIAVGGMAEVWEATDTVLDRAVAIKVLHPHLADDQAFVERFRREAIAAARLTHPSIVAIYDTWSGDGEEAIVMELVRGTSLRQHLDEHGRLPPGEAVAIGARVAEALATAHRAGLVHRDIKPANILLCEDERVMVADFGIAKLADADHTAEGTVLGTAKYLAPEQVQGAPVDARTDLYALGIVLYEMVCGRVPFSGESDTATVLARLHQDPVPPRRLDPEVPAALEGVILRALRREPADRPASAEDLRSELLASVRASTIHPPPPPARTVAPVPDATAADGGTLAAGTAVATRPPAAPPPSTAPAPRPAAAGSPPRNWTGRVLVIALVLVALALAGVLLGSTIGEQLFGADEPELPGAGAGPGTDDGIAIAAAGVFDPTPGDGEENDETVGLVTDGEEGAAWSTEGYNTADLGGLKDGVGLVLTLDQVADLEELVVASTSSGWSAEVYVAEAPATDLAGWGEPVATGEDLADTVAFDLGGARGGAVLLWLTALAGPDDDGRFRVGVAEAGVR